ncbi:hypothetical protein [Cytophaga aurantiaca]|uniref:hypothetical protein n=1 Tax=Cytophaga aurantiaca TaxID=29530 RepID=UPI000369843C|nr:hypothetical protein [Cytophaga aurantiaca]
MKKILIVIFLFPITLFAQSDKSISAKNIPKNIPEFLGKYFPSHGKVSYFIEQDGDTMCYEADFKYMKQQYSLLFDTLGNMIEKEIKISFDTLPDLIKKSIEGKLTVDLEKYKIEQTQTVDYRGKLLYEIQVRGKKNKEIEFYEYYFNRAGEFVKVETIVLKPIPSLY